MKTKFDSLAVMLLVLLTAGQQVIAAGRPNRDTNDVAQVGGSHTPGHVRPPLWMNINPAPSSGYTPAQIRHAYGIDQLPPTTTGAGQTIAIVVAYGSSTIQNDLNSFCASFPNLPTTTVRIYYPQGKPKLSNTGWAQETSLDVQWAHAIAPGATIALVVAKSPSFSDMLGAVDYAVNNVGAKVVSMSWGGAEFSGQTSTAYDGHFSNPAVTFVASSGDNGEGVEWPAACPNVLSVGGTRLFLDSAGNRTSPETAWSGSGGDVSVYEPPQAYQSGWHPTLAVGRGVPDVSYVADPSTGVLVVYRGAWYVFGGTSAGAPQWAALVALSNSQRTSGGALGTANPLIYAWAGNAPAINPNYFVDIVSGNNGPGLDDYATVGYDPVTGLGSPVANALVPALAGPGFWLTITPSTAAVPYGGGTAAYTVNINRMSFAGDVSLSVSGLPASAAGIFTPTTTTGNSSTLTVTVPQGTSPGSYPFTVMGTSGSLTRTASATLIQRDITETIFSSATPTMQWAGNQPYEYGTVFRSAKAGTISKVRLVCGPGETGAHTVRIWQNNTGAVISGPYAWTPATGQAWQWQEFVITPTLIQANTDYTVSISTGTDKTAYVAYIDGYFNNPGGNGVNLTWPAGAGVYTTTPGARPTLKGGGNSGYMRDVVFTPSSTP